MWPRLKFKSAFLFYAPLNVPNSSNAKKLCFTSKFSFCYPLENSITKKVARLGSQFSFAFLTEDRLSCHVIVLSDSWTSVHFVTMTFTQTDKDLFPQQINTYNSKLSSQSTHMKLFKMNKMNQLWWPSRPIRCHKRIFFSFFFFYFQLLSMLHTVPIKFFRNTNIYNLHALLTNTSRFPVCVLVV